MQIRRGTTISGSEPFTSACFSNDGAAIITTTAQNTECWDAHTGEALAVQSAPHRGNACKAFALRWIAAGKGAANDFGGFAVVDRDSSSDIGFIREPFPDICGATSSPDGRYVAIGYQHGRLRVETLPQAEPLFLNGHSTSMNNHMHQNSIEYLEFDSSSRLLISKAEEDGSPKLWDLQQRRQSCVWNGKPAFQMAYAVALNEVTDSTIDTIRFSPVDAAFVCTHRSQKTAQIYVPQAN
ncbi:MAG: WD40 repeat domain-containing protein [Pseudomonadota bacterium]